MNEEEIFYRALTRRSSEEREAYLDQACAANPALRASVEALLKANVGATGFLERPAAQVLPSPFGRGAECEGAATDYSRPITEGPGTLIGPYKLLEQIGEGGMGVVYVAEQIEPVRRRVALKIIKPGMDTKQVIARFEAERQALAMMDHPHIAKVLDAGTTDAGRPYFVMELVRGMPFTDYCDKVRLSPRQRLELFVDVCHAIQHAHQKGIIHRDLKPSNILITLHDGKPVVKVIDFGVAKAIGQQLTERTVYTALTQLVGTPLYMSPEQAELSGLDIDTRSDVYSLGVLLYELLTGQTPFDKDRLKSVSFDEMRRMIREDEPLRPSRRFSTLGAAAISTASQHRGVDERRLSRILSGELDWIVMKALEKDRSRRYESASALAADIQRYLSDEPVLACPPTTMYRFHKFARKHKPALATAAAIAACLLLGTTVSAWQAVRATTAEAQANVNEQKAVASAVTAREKEQEAIKQRDEVKALADKLAAKEQQLERTLYAAHMNLARHAWEEADVARVLALLQEHRPKSGELDQRRFEWHYLYRLCHSELLALHGHTGAINSVAYSPDGSRLASASEDNTVKVWEAQTGQELFTFKEHTAAVQSVAFSPDGKRLASASGSPERTVKVWDAQTGKELFALKNTGTSVAYSPDGKRLVSVSWDSTSREATLKVCDAETGEELLSLKEGGSPVAFSPDGKRLASGSWDDTVKFFTVKVWDAQTGEKLVTFNGHTDYVRSVTFSPDGQRLASSGSGGLKVWDAQSGRELLVFEGRYGGVAFSPDGKRLAGTGSEVKVWDAQTGQQLLTIKGAGSNVVFSPNGKHLASSSADKTVKVWDAQKDQENVKLQLGGGGVVALSQDFRRLARASSDKTVEVWDAQTGQRTVTLRGHSVQVSSIVFSPDGTRLASGGGGARLPGGTFGISPGDRAEVKMWDVQTGQELLNLKVDTISYSVVFSPDGKLLASASGNRRDQSLRVKVWDTQTGQELHSLIGHTHFINSVKFSADGKHLASASDDKTVKVWNVQTGQELLTYKGHTGYVWSVAFSPDGKRVASAGSDKTVKVWEAQTGQELLTIEGTGSTVVFSPDGKRLSSAGKLWDSEAGQELLSISGGGFMAFSADGHRLAAGGPKSTILIYDATPLPEK